MTREEAREILTHNWTRVDNPNYLESELDEAFFMAIEALSAEPSGDDLIIKGAKGIKDGLYNIKDGELFQYKAKGGTVRVYSIVPSAEAEPIVIRSKTLLPTKDFKEWAKRIREVNPNAIVIPCDAEVVSADAEWIPCSERLPSDSGNYLITVADFRLGHIGEHTVTIADFYAKGKKWNSVVDVFAWMPLPKPYRGGDDE